ncbi:helix-turn-helix domain-containing protein [Bacteroidota bacterium]
MTSEIDFKKLAEANNLSYSRFRTIFKSKMGVSLQQYLIGERLENAKRLMINTDLSLTEISDKTGFNSLFYFSKVFKSKMGYPPSKIRRNGF